MSHWLKKALITAMTIATISPSNNMNTQEYDIRLRFFNTKVGNAFYEPENRKLAIEVSRFADVAISYKMLNDSLYIETNENEDLKEEFIYKKDSVWYLDDYVVFAGKARADKVALIGETYPESNLFALELLNYYLEKPIVKESQDTLGIILFGKTYKAFVTGNQNSKSENVMDYKFELDNFTSSNADNFIVDDHINYSIKKLDSTRVLQSADTRVKAYGLKFKVRVRPVIK